MTTATSSRRTLFALLSEQRRFIYLAVILLSVAGILIYFTLSLLSYLLLRRWHESAVQREL